MICHYHIYLHFSFVWILAFWKIFGWDWGLRSGGGWGDVGGEGGEEGGAYKEYSSGLPGMEEMDHFWRSLESAV